MISRRKGLRGPVLAQERAEAQARLDQVRIRQQRSTMTSPIDGTVLRREVPDERYLAAGAVLLELGRLDDLEVEAEILTQDAVRLMPGQPVAVGDTWPKTTLVRDCASVGPGMNAARAAARTIK